MKTVAIDFDGVIHKYGKGWQDGSIYDEVNEGAFEYIQKLMRDGYAVFIFSTRSSRQIKQWLIPYVMVSEYEAEGMGNDPTLWKYTRYGFTVEKIPFWTKFWNKRNVLGITKRKLPAVAYIDDRAVRFLDFQSLPKNFS
jgi:hypothetical protein